MLVPRTGPAWGSMMLYSLFDTLQLRVTGWPAISVVCFFFQAEDGIRDTSVTGVQTCALPIYALAGEVLELRDAAALARPHADGLVGVHRRAIAHRAHDALGGHPALDGQRKVGKRGADELSLARLQRLRHLLARAQDLQLHVDAVLEEDALLDADEARHVVHVAADGCGDRRGRLRAGAWRNHDDGAHGHRDEEELHAVTSRGDRSEAGTSRPCSSSPCRLRRGTASACCTSPTTPCLSSLHSGRRCARPSTWCRSPSDRGHAG